MVRTTCDGCTCYQANIKLIVVRVYIRLKVFGCVVRFSELRDQTSSRARVAVDYVLQATILQIMQCPLDIA